MFERLFKKKEEEINCWIKPNKEIKFEDMLNINNHKNIFVGDKSSEEIQLLIEEFKENFNYVYSDIADRKIIMITGVERI